MQVTHVTDHCTHAVIGGSKTIEFGISESAEFFNILSSTLYTNQKLAVVRETICNAWDAHIAAGKTDTAIELTLEDGMFTVKDYGLGIPQDKIGPIYGVYGASTKLNDGKQTGGFGLGCKAPFAYVDHFEVTSASEGIKTIYTMSKASYQSGGKPGITQITAFPSTETGLEVRIKVKPEDESAFRQLIQNIVFNGDIKATLNGKELNTLGFPKDVYFMFSKGITSVGADVSVRYGNVIYPVPHHDTLAIQLGKFKNILTTLNKAHYGYYRLVFQAPPHSISVTPSREHLSMQEKTCETLTKLFNDFLCSFNKEANQEMLDLMRTASDKAIKAGHIHSVLNRASTLPTSVEPTRNKGTNGLVSARQYSEEVLEGHYPEEKWFRYADVSYRVSSLIKEGKIDRGLGHTFLRHLREAKDENLTENNLRQFSDTWFQKHITRPLAKKLLADPSGLLSVAGLYVLDSFSMVKKNKSYYENGIELLHISQTKLRNTAMGLPYLAKIVVLSSNKSTLQHRLYHHPLFKERCSVMGVLVYHTGRKKGADKAATDFFKKEGYVVIDATVLFPWEKSEVKASTPRKKKLPGLPIVSSCKNAMGNYIFSQLREEEKNRTETPEFIVRFKYESGSTRVSSLLPNMILGFALRKWGDKAGAVFTPAEEKKWLAKGIPDLETYVVQEICKILTSDIKYLHYYSLNSGKVKMLASEMEVNSRVIDFIWGTPAIGNLFGVAHKLQDEDMEIVDVFSRMKGYMGHHKEVETTKNLIESIPLDPAVEALMTKLSKARLIPLLDFHELRYILKNASEKEQQKIQEIFKTLIN